MLLGWRRIEFLERNWRRIAGEVKEIAQDYGRVYKVVVFGSVIKGKATGSSDLDIAVIYEDSISDREKRRRAIEISLRLPEEESLVTDVKVLSKDESELFLSFVGTYVEI
jgi:predicted nucleotidyltransferase